MCLLVARWRHLTASNHHLEVRHRCTEISVFGHSGAGRLLRGAIIVVDGIHIQSVKYVIGSNKAALTQAISSQFLPLSPLAPQHCVRSQLDTRHTDAMGPYHSHSLSKLGRSRMWSGKTEGERIRIRGVRTMMKGTRKGDQEKKGKEEKVETIEQSPPRNNSGSSTPTPLTVDHPGVSSVHTQ